MGVGWFKLHIQRTNHAASTLVRYRGLDHCNGHVPVTEQLQNRAYVLPTLFLRVLLRKKPSMDPSIAAAIIGGLATILAALIGIRWQRKHEMPAIKNYKPPVAEDAAAETSASKFARRYLEYPSHFRFIKSLPKLKAVVMENAQEGWDTGVTADMREASYDVIDFLEYAWLRLAQFYPKEHWGGEDAETYIRDYLKGRFAFHWSKHEPSGPGTGGTIVGVLVGGDVIDDMERLIEDTVSALFMYRDDFDFTGWKHEWCLKRR